jgi:hypothetical protein
VSRGSFKPDVRGFTGLSITYNRALNQNRNGSCPPMAAALHGASSQAEHDAADFDGSAPVFSEGRRLRFSMIAR